MKKKIFCFMLMLSFVANTTIAQKIDHSATTETPELFSKNFAKAVISNDETILNNAFPTAQELIDLLKSNGRFISKNMVKTIEETRASLLKEYQNQIKGLREVAEIQGFNWDDAIINSVTAIKAQENTIGVGNKATPISYNILIDLIANDKQLLIYSERVFMSSNGFRIGQISNWRIN